MLRCAQGQGRRRAQLVQHLDGEQQHEEVPFDADFWSGVLDDLGSAMAWLDESVSLGEEQKRSRLRELGRDDFCLATTTTA